jgi:hypothetical protein
MLPRIRNPRSLFTLATGCLALFGLLGMPRLASSLNESALDGARGALLGAAIALVYLMFRVKRQAAR